MNAVTLVPGGLAIGPNLVIALWPSARWRLEWNRKIQRYYRRTQVGPLYVLYHPVSWLQWSYPWWR